MPIDNEKSKTTQNVHLREERGKGNAMQSIHFISDSEQGIDRQNEQENLEQAKGIAPEYDNSKRRIWIELSNKDIRKIKRIMGVSIRDSKKNQRLNTPTIESFIKLTLDQSNTKKSIFIDNFCEEFSEKLMTELQGKAFLAGGTDRFMELEKELDDTKVELETFKMMESITKKQSNN